MQYSIMAGLVWGIVATSCIRTVMAQTYERMQPIVLTSSPACCQSPARISQQPVARRAFGGSYMAPSVAESIPSVIEASEMVPLPAGPSWRGYSPSSIQPVVEYIGPGPAPSVRVEALPSAASLPHQTLRPITGPIVPEGYVLGEGLIGQPKLYKPGQPMRNLLRYLSL